MRPDSQEAVLLHLYNELTLRNDYGEIYVYDTKPPSEPRSNYYVRDEGIVYWNHVKKTGDRYDVPAFKYSEETQEVIERSLAREPREKLISKTPWYLLKKVALVSTNFAMQKLVRSTVIRTRRTRKRALAYQMHHSFATQKIYVRQLRGRFVQAQQKFR